MKIDYCVQYSPRWWALRRGIPTASQFDRIITPKAWVPGKAQPGYAATLAAETAELNPNFFTERPMSPAQRHGLETEPEARRFYTMHREYSPDQVQMVGFCWTDDGRFGCSPDALVSGDPEGNGVLELKCPEGKTHAKYLMSGTLPPEYKPQVHGHLLVTGASWVDFLSYSPGLDPLLIRVYPDADTLKLREALESFDILFNATLAKLGLKRLRPTPPQEDPQYAAPEPTVGVGDPREEPIGPFADGTPTF